MIIAVDADDTVADSVPAFSDFSNERYGTNLKKTDFTHHDFLKIWGVSREEMTARWAAFDRIHGQGTILPLPGSQITLARLARRHSLHLVTYRHIGMIESTKRWLAMNFEGMFSGVHLCGGEDGHIVRIKSEVCKEIGAEMIIEDHPLTAEQCAIEGIRVLLFDQPWNRNGFPKHASAITRISDWHDKILETLL